MIDAGGLRAALRRAAWLEIGSLFWLLVMGAAAVAAGLASRSLSVTAFGVVGLIEMLSASAVLWRLWIETLVGSVSGTAELVEQAERGAVRFIAVSFGALALLVAAGAARAVAERAVPAPGLGDLAVACAAALVMPGLWALKSRAGRVIGSAALDADAAGNLACAVMAWVLLAGLLAQRAGLWWADPAAALIIGALVVREAWGTWQGGSRAPRDPVRVFLGLGSNVGDRAYWLADAAAKLQGPALSVVRRSCIYETPPWGKTDQPAFLNQVLEVETTLGPSALLARCQAVERALGRVRAERWGPRVIDVDILLYGDAVIRARGLTVPHPDLDRRAFVLVPLLELRPSLTLPDGRTGAELLAALPDRAAIVPWGADTRGGAARV